ncbi:MAG: DUF502 domain-containing protein [Dehalococcoidia bacterium]|nr:DUF502 domain-containing protein [Dehalococcoidia bacterium]
MEDNQDTNSQNNTIKFDVRSNYHLLRRIFKYFIHGMVMTIPWILTVWIILWSFNLIDGVLAPAFAWVFGRSMPGLGFATIILSFVLIGYLGVKIGHRKVLDFLEARFIKFPVLGMIYGSTKQIISSFTTAGIGKFLEVVFIEFPRKGIYTIGLVTSEALDRDGGKILNVYIPTVPNPTNGFLQIVHESDVVHSSMSISDAMKLVISAGKVSCSDVTDISKGFPEMSNA